MTERRINREEREYKKLEAVAKMLEMLSPNNAKYVVEDVYLDLGQEWMWTTICRKGYRECQILSPREWQDIMEAETTQDIADIVEEIRADRFFGDIKNLGKRQVELIDGRRLTLNIYLDGEQEYINLHGIKTRVIEIDGAYEVARCFDAR